MKLRKKGKVLEFLSGKIWTKLTQMPDEIESFLELDSGDILVMLFHNPTDHGQNIFLIGSDGSRKWETQKREISKEYPNICK